MEEFSDKSEPCKKHFMKLVSDLHNSSNSVVYKALTQLRTDASKNKFADKYLCEISAFKVLAKFLKLPNDKILSVTLSILANSSLKDDCRKQIGESDIVVPLVSILKHIAQESIQNRACRLAANLAMSKDIASELYEQKIVSAIICIIVSSKSSGTHQSAIRALRIIWESSKNYRSPSVGVGVKDVMLAEGIVKSVAAKLGSDNKEVVKAALRAVLSFSEYSPAVCANQLRLVDDNGFSLLLSIMPDPLVHQIIYNLSRCRPGVFHLNQCHAVQSLTQLLSLPENQKDKLLIYTLCSLCDNCNGSMQLLTSDNGLNVFLCILDKTDNYSIKSKLYNVLLKLVFEPQTLLRFTKFGLVKVLINKLDTFISTYGKPHCNIESTIKEEDKWSQPMLSPQNSPRSEHNLSKSHLTFGVSSPYSGASSYSSLSGSVSPSHSYLQTLSPPLTEVAVYSPVCSLSDDDDIVMLDGDDKDMNESDSVNNSIQLFDDERICPDNKSVLNVVVNGSAVTGTSIPAEATKEPITEDASIVYLLLKLTHSGDTYLNNKKFYIEDLVSERTISILIKYLVHIRHVTSNQYVVNLFKSLVAKEQYYCDLLDKEFALEIHRNLCRPVHVKCNRCDELNKTGECILEEGKQLSEAGLGEGQMAHRLLTGPNDVKLQIALTIPHVSRDASFLLKLLLKYKAMDFLIDRLLIYNEISSASLEDIAYSLKLLFMKLKFENPQEKTAANHRCVGCDVGKLRKESSIIFSLDDGTIVPANKTSLCNNSPVFDAMLNGNFKESEQHEVKISDISEKCLQHFVKLIDTYCECILPDDVHVLLELISISDRYLVSKLMKNILSFVMSHVLNYKNCQIVYRWAKECKLPFGEKISNDVIKYLFTSKMSCKQLRKGLTLMMDGLHKDIFIKDVTDMIKDALYCESRKKLRK